MSKSEYNRIADLRTKMEGGANITTSDVDWLLSLSKRAGTAKQSSDRARQVILVFAGGRKSSLPVDRIQNVYDFAVQATQFSGTPHEIPLFGCIVLGKLKNKNAIPYVKALLTYPDVNVRFWARKELHELSK